MDIRTLIQTAMIVWLVSSLSLVFIWWTRKTYPGFGYWVLYSLGVTMGLQLLSLHGSVPPFIPVLVGNGLILVGSFLALKGIGVFFCKGLLRPRYWIALALAESGLAWFTYITPSLSLRVFLVSSFLGTVSIVMARQLLSKAPFELRTSSYFAGVIMMGNGMFHLLRGFLTVSWIPLPAFFSRNIIQDLNFISSITVSLLGAVGFIMMNNQRLEHEMNLTGIKLQASLKELEEKISAIKILGGLLPICASCKRIRDDQGYWKQIEVHIRDHSEADFSHGICPECMKKLYPDYSDRVKSPQEKIQEKSLSSKPGIER